MTNKQRGSVLILTLLLMVTSVGITLAYITMIKYDATLVSNQADGARALYTAEAGLNKAAWYLLNTAPDGSANGSWRTLSYPSIAGAGTNDPQEESFEGGTFTLWVEDSDGSILITSSGTYRGLTRVVHQRETLNGSPMVLAAVAGSWGAD